MRKIDVSTPLGRAMKAAVDWCRKTHETVYVLHDSLDEPDEYHVTQAFTEQTQRIRFTAEWVDNDVHGTRS